MALDNEISDRLNYMVTSTETNVYFSIILKFLLVVSIAFLYDGVGQTVCNWDLFENLTISKGRDNI